MNILLNYLLSLGEDGAEGVLKYIYVYVYIEHVV